MLRAPFLPGLDFGLVDDFADGEGEVRGVGGGDLLEGVCAGVYGGEDGDEGGWGREGAGGEDKADKGGELFVAEGGGGAGARAKGFDGGGAGGFL